MRLFPRGPRAPSAGSLFACVSACALAGSAAPADAAGQAPRETLLRPELAEPRQELLGALRDLDAPVSALVVNHLAHHHGQTTFSDPSVRRLARRLAPATIDELAAVMRADSNGRPPLTSPETHARIDELVARAHALTLADACAAPYERALTLLARAALEVATQVLDRLPQLSGADDDAPDRSDKLRAFLATLAERAFRRPLSDEDRAFFVDRCFQDGLPPELAVKRGVALMPCGASSSG